MESELRALHFQLTRNCNLRCAMCGQWGSHGYQRGRQFEAELAKEDWFRILDEVRFLASRITLWGGEPLLAPHCLEVARHARFRGFRVDLVTNGVLLASLAAGIDDLFETIFISVDGSPGVHDKIRGVAGTFDAIEAGIVALRAACPRQRLAIKTTLVRDNMADLAALAGIIRRWTVDQWFIDPQMFLSAQRQRDYSAFQESHGVGEATAESWRADFPPAYGAKCAEAIRALLDGNADLPVQFGVEGLQAGDLAPWFDVPDRDLVERCCRAPHRRLSIQSTGETAFCLDITDGSFGNVRKASALAIFHSEQAERFRRDVAAGRNPACLRCVWKWNCFGEGA